MRPGPVRRHRPPAGAPPGRTPPGPGPTGGGSDAHWSAIVGTMTVAGGAVGMAASVPPRGDLWTTTPRAGNPWDVAASVDPTAVWSTLAWAVVVGLGVYLGAVSLLQTAARLSGRRWLVTLATRCTHPALRGLMAGTVAAAALVPPAAAASPDPTSGPVGVGHAGTPPPPTTAVIVRLDHAGTPGRGVDAGPTPPPTAVVVPLPPDTPTTTTRHPPAPPLPTPGPLPSDTGASDPTGAAGEPPPDPTGPVTPTPEPSPGGAATAGTWVVSPGEHFWSVASAVVTGSGTGDEREVVRYWLRLIERNRDRLPDPTNPDLVLPGTVLDLPPVGPVSTAGGDRP